MGLFTFKSYCWSFGTTSFRTRNFNRSIEEQLRLLREFWSLPQNKDKEWSANEKLQSSYYDFMKAKGFVVGEANKKAKDAREKTSGLVDIGLISPNRKLTNVGRELLMICDSNDFKDNNIFQIDKDSLIYLKQMLKVSYVINGETIKPFIIFAYILSSVGTLSAAEFTYLLPLAINKETTDYVISSINCLRKGTCSINDLIINCLMKMENYSSALNYFSDCDITEEVVMDIGMNRKSRESDKPYFNLYKALKQVYLNNDSNSIFDLLLATKDIKIGRLWRNYLFDTSNKNAIKNDPLSHLNRTLFSSITTESELKVAFFKIMHLFKAKATLSDYFDLNKRYLKTTDCILFIDGEVKFDLVPGIIFSKIINNLFEKAFEKSTHLYENIPLNKIDSSFEIEEPFIIQKISKIFNVSISSISEAKEKIQDERYERLHHLIDTKFTKENLLHLLNCFENRNDDEIQKLVTDNADVPTIFEYVLGIAWYIVSERKGKILDYLKLSLDSDLLPKSHAQGGEADIVYEYDETANYPKHSLLLEATLSDSTNQRRMELEPVSRHLGQHLIKNAEKNSYCLFLTTFLHINVLSDFRYRKNMPYYNSQNPNVFVNGMKIIPVQTAELKIIIKNDMKYAELYEIFDKAFLSNDMSNDWYKNCIVDKLSQRA